MKKEGKGLKSGTAAEKVKRQRYAQRRGTKKLRRILRHNGPHAAALYTAEHGLRVELRKLANEPNKTGNCAREAIRRVPLRIS